MSEKEQFWMPIVRAVWTTRILRTQVERGPLVGSGVFTIRVWKEDARALLYGARLRGLTYDGDGDPAAMGCGAVFPDVDPLPGSQVARAGGDGEGE